MLCFLNNGHQNSFLLLKNFTIIDVELYSKNPLCAGQVWNLITRINPFFDFFPFRVALNIFKYTRKTEHW